MVNTASASGTDPNEDPVRDDDSETVTGELSPGILVTKTASPATFSAVATVAPAEMPTKMPSSAASRREMAMASSSLAVSSWS